MGLLQKFKNIFVEEVEEEVIPEKKEFTSIKRSEQPDITKSTPVAPVLKEEEKPVQPAKKDEKFVFPVYFDDKDFEEIKRETEKKNVVQPKKEMQPIKKNEDNGGHRESYKEAYNNKKNIETREKKVFKPTPIISPVYGILDKNYYKEDIVVTTTTRTSYKESNKPITIDDFIRKCDWMIESLIKSYELDPNECFIINKEGHILIDGNLTYLFLSFVEQDFLAYMCDRCHDLFKDGVAVSDSYILRHAFERLDEESLNKIRSNDK